MVTTIVFIFILSLLIVVHEWGHFMAARRVGVRVEKFSLGFGPQLFRKKKGDTEYSVSAIPLGGFVKLAGDSLEEFKGKSDEYLSKPPGERFQIIFAGPLLNYILGLLCFWFIFFVGYPTLTTKVGGLVEGFGAQKAGLQIGDTITSIDGKPVVLWEDLQRIVQSKKQTDTVRLEIERNRAKLLFDVSIREKSLDDQMGSQKNVGLLGITPYDEIIKVRYGFVRSFFLGVSKTYELTVLSYKGLWRLISGRLSMKDSVTGPLGIFYITSKAASMGVIAVLHLIAVLSISLGIFNLLPFPVLDGGHILFLGIERIRGKNLSLKSERIITRIGLTAIISLAVFVTYNDILRFFGEKITKFFR